MMSIRTLLGVLSLATAVHVSARTIESRATTNIQFCTQAVYATGGCPYAQPTSGGGTCGIFSVKPSVCYTFNNFTNTPPALVNHVNYISIPSGGSVTGCNLYKSTNCTITPDQEWDACDVGNTDLTCRKHLAGGVISFVCS